MKYNIMFDTAESISVLGLGTWVFGGENWGGSDEGACALAVREASGIGVNFVDTAPFYGDGLSETIVGKAIRGQREKFFIATKCGLVRNARIPCIDLSPKSILNEIDQSLLRLQCDYIDLYQPHWPDKAVAIGSTMDVLLQLQAVKKIRYIGVCNFNLEQLKTAIKYAPVKTLQVQYSLIDKTIEHELLPFCIENKIGVIAYGALGGGILTGKYENPPKVGKLDARNMFYKFYNGTKFSDIKVGLEEIQKLGRPLPQIALNWVRQQPGILTVLAGCRCASQVLANMTSCEWGLTQSELETIRKVAFLK